MDPCSGFSEAEASQGDEPSVQNAEDTAEGAAIEEPKVDNSTAHACEATEQATGGSEQDISEAETKLESEGAENAKPEESTTEESKNEVAADTGPIPSEKDSQETEVSAQSRGKPA